MSKWQAIEAAPRGRDILVGVWVEDRWSSWSIRYRDQGTFGCDGEYGDDPTHWTSVPRPPRKPAKPLPHNGIEP